MGKKKAAKGLKSGGKSSRFAAESAYAAGIFRSAIGDHRGAIQALELALEHDPSYAQAVLAMGSIEYQRKKPGDGRRLFHALIAMPENIPDLHEIIDEAGDFLIQSGAYEDGFDLFRAAAARFSQAAVFHQGLGCCACRLGRHEEAIRASERALELEPGRQAFVSDLGWCLFQAGRHQEARQVMRRAVSLDASDDRARENLRLCEEQIRKLTVPGRKGSGEGAHAQVDS